VQNLFCFSVIFVPNLFCVVGVQNLFCVGVQNLFCVGVQNLFCEITNKQVFNNKGQPQGIAPTQCHVGAIPCGCPLSVFFKYLKIYGSVLILCQVETHAMRLYGSTPHSHSIGSAVVSRKISG